MPSNIPIDGVPLIRRRALGRERVFRNRSNPIDAFDDVELFTKFRFRRAHIISLTDSIQHVIEHPYRLGTLLPVQQVCLALRLYATGTFQDFVFVYTNSQCQL
eukprot:TRINITY_DN480_c0_g1_i6.p2 TRINITY_DN480_c0_g1~~TRINITY_DN480_c0_g1_i6.p2  ORF type:complete len:103 (-),score=5.00 TRINITY_DN480_c0_g1_i6:435-743(-)